MTRKAGISAKAETPAESAMVDGSAPSCSRRTERKVKPARMPTWMSPMASRASGSRGARARATLVDPNRLVEPSRVRSLAPATGAPGGARDTRIHCRGLRRRLRCHRRQVGALDVRHEGGTGHDDDGRQREEDGHRQVAGPVVDEAGHDGRDGEGEARHQPDPRVVAPGVLDAVDGQRVRERREGRLRGREGDEAEGHDQGWDGQQRDGRGPGPHRWRRPAAHAVARGRRRRCVPRSGRRP